MTNGQGPIAKIPVWVIVSLLGVSGAIVTVYATHESRLAVVESAMQSEREMRKEQAALLSRMDDKIDDIRTAVVEFKSSVKGAMP